jgi:ribosomal-protein-alanine N-acetyltransferase
MIQLNQLRLRAFRADDLPFVFAGLSDPKVIQYYGISYQTERQCEAQMLWYQRIASEGTGYWLAIESAQNQQPLGALGLNDICRQHHQAALGYWLLPQYWGRGIMKEALRGLLHFAFEQMKLHRIYAEVELENIASQQLLQALNFRMEGISRDCEFKDPTFISLMNYALLKHEFMR